MNVVILSFLFFLIVFTIIGVLSSVLKKSTTQDYLIADRSVNPWMTALSAVATNNSGFMFIGLIGYTYRNGFSAVWMMVGWILGDLTGWLLVHSRVRRVSEEMNVSTIPGLMGTYEDRVSRPVIAVAGLLTFVLLGVYSAAQLKAGSTALHTLFGWDLRAGAIIGAVIVVLYCFSGGIRASIWTDCAQSIVMIVAMILLLIAAAMKAGGPAAVWENLHAQDPQLVNWFPENLEFGFLLYLLGMTFGGFGAVGQPHILVRFMAIRSVAEMRSARGIYFLWFVPFFVAGIAVGLYSRVLIPDIASLPSAAGLSATQATELAMPVMARQLLPDVLIGLTLAGLFSATMSTADSQILVCSGALTQDINPRWKDSYAASKIGTLLVASLALGIALFANQGVFSLVLIAWSALGAGLGPVVILRVFGRPVNSATALLMMTAGVATVIVWNLSGYDDDLFKLLPGMAAAFGVYGVSRLLSLDQLKPGENLAE
ncbi:MAG TPA: sodium/proline symporter [Planctomycetaceae bacterium]|nr:sodium/proline symporter [Planctomycetaceae bacterium]